MHELGHALTARKYGARPEILLHSFGGLAIYNDRQTRGQRLRVIAAGPGYGLVLGSAALLVWFFLLPRLPFRPNDFLLELVWVLMWINIAWSLLNMLPILPLDGGQFLEAWMRGDKRRLRGQIGTGVAIAVVVFALFYGWFFVAIMFGFFAYQNYQVAEGKPMRRMF